MKKENKVGKQLAAFTLTGIVAGGLAGAAIAANLVDDTETVTQLSELVAEREAEIAALEAQGPVVVTETVVKEVPVNVTVEKEVLVDNGNLDLVLNEIYDNDGSVEYLTDDLDADEVDQVVDRIVFVNDIKALSLAEVESEIADLVDKEVVNGTSLDEDDVEKIRLDNDSDEVIIDAIDFDDKDATVIVTGDFRHDDVDYEFEVEVEIRDGSVIDSKLVSVVEE